MTGHRLAIAWTVAQGLAEALLVGLAAVLLTYSAVAVLTWMDREDDR